MTTAMSEPAGAAASPQQLAQAAARLAAAGDMAGAEPMFARFVELVPDNANGWSALGRCRLALGRPESALIALRRAGQLAPGDRATAINLAGILLQLNRAAEALAVLDALAARVPADAAVAFNRGRALAALGDSEAARQAWDQALQLDARLVPALSARAQLLAAEGDITGALLDLDQALAQRPADRGLRLRRAELTLAGGDWLGGLADHDLRFDPAASTEDWRPALPLYRPGMAIEGRRLLLFAEPREEGRAIGEVLQMLRLVPALLPRCAAVALEVPARLAGWLQSQGKLPHGVVALRRGECGEADLAVPLLSLLQLCDIDPFTLPALPAVAQQGATAARVRRVGLALEVEGPAELRRRREVPLAALEVLRSRPEIEWLALQPMQGRPAWIAAAGLPVAPDAGPMAAQLERLDLVVAADNWIAHLAGSRGQRLALLLDVAADWRWLRGRSDTPWYGSARLYRQPAPGQWATPLAQLARDIAATG